MLFAPVLLVASKKVLLSRLKHDKSCVKIAFSELQKTDNFANLARNLSVFSLFVANGSI